MTVNSSSWTILHAAISKSYRIFVTEQANFLFLNVSRTRRPQWENDFFVHGFCIRSQIVLKSFPGRIMSNFLSKIGIFLNMSTKFLRIFLILNDLQAELQWNAPMQKICRLCVQALKHGLKSENSSIRLLSPARKNLLQKKSLL